MELLKNKTVFITGGSRGIGAAIAKTFAAQGASVGFSYRSSHEAAAEVLNDLKQFGQPCASYVCHVSDTDQVQQTMEAFLQQFGRIDILVNNAGIVRDNLICDISLTDWQEVLNTNLSAAHWHIQCALRNMIPNRSGNIINISSVVGVQGNVGQANYAASKAGLIALTKTVAREVGRRNIRCNTIVPGIIDTDMSKSAHLDTEGYVKHNIALRRLGTAEEVADVALFLASDLSRYVTGQEIQVCGGFTY